MAVHGDRRRAAGLAGAVARLTAAAIPLVAICAGVGALVAGGAGAIMGVVVVGVVLAVAGSSVRHRVCAREARHVTHKPGRAFLPESVTNYIGSARS